MYIHNAELVKRGARASLIPYKTYHFADGEKKETDKRVDAGMCNGVTLPEVELHTVEYLCLSETAWHYALQVGKVVAIQPASNRNAVCFRAVSSIERVGLSGFILRDPFAKQLYCKTRLLTAVDVAWLGYDFVTVGEFINWCKVIRWLPEDDDTYEFKKQFFGEGLFWLVRWNDDPFE